MNPLQNYLSGAKQRWPLFDAAHMDGTHIAEWLGPRAVFLRELVQEPRFVGAACASSRALASRMACWVDPAEVGWFIELGGGTGTITAALLQRGVRRERLIVMERSLHFVHHLRRRFPGVRIVHADAAEIACTKLHGRPVTAIVSGLPLRSMPANAVSRAVQACSEVLNPHSRVVQFTYAPRGFSAWQMAGLHRMANETVWCNLPPARIEVFTPGPQPRCASAAKDLPSCADRKVSEDRNARNLHLMA